MKNIFKLLVLFALSATVTRVLAQGGYDVSGNVVNEKGEPVKAATVFISGSEKIMPTTDDGRFRFTRISPGTFKLSVQMMGYAPMVKNIIIKNAPVTIEMHLQQKAISLNEVVIGSTRAFEKNLEIFKEQFLGRSRNGRESVIINPKAIHFTTRKKILLADADEFLVIENKRLGYRIRYQLQDFGYNSTTRMALYHGESSFEELEGTEDQKKAWAKNRAEAYKGSFRHFLRSVYANNVLENGFIARELFGFGKYNSLDSLTDPDRLIVSAKPVKFDTLITAIDTNFVSVKIKQLYVIYDPKKAAALRLEAQQKTAITGQKKTIFNEDASLVELSADQPLIDKKGNYAGYSFIKGYWAQARMGDELPFDYVSPFAEMPRGNIPVNKPAYALQAWTNNNPQEKAYLHMDRPYYALGDTLWFKGYLTSGSRNQLSTISGAAYVDLVNDQNQIIKTLKLPVESGTVAGNFILDDEVKQGSYTIRAYTQWMRNAGEDYFFSKVFTVGNLNAQPVIAAGNKKDNKTTPTAAITSAKNKTAALQQTDIQFFPESGNLVNGITSKVGFKATGANGLGQEISAIITDNENVLVARFSTLHAGMGSFSIKPVPGKTYTAKIKFADSTSKSMTLPDATNQGYVLSVYQPNKDTVLVRINASARLQPSTVILVVQSSGELIYTSKVEITGAITSVWLDKNSFPSGIAQFTLFNADNEPLNERIAFIKNTDRMQLALKSKPVYKAKEHVQLNLDALGSLGAPIAANFSVAVINESEISVDESAESTIFSTLLLTSDLKGYVEKPNYYFMTDSDVVNKALDNLMLTQGYRRFEWNALVNTIETKPLIVREKLDEGASRSFRLIGEPSEKINVLSNIVTTKPKFQAEGRDVAISGYVSTLTHKPLPNAVVLLVSLNARINKTTTTDENGRFKFDKLIFADSAKFAIQARDVNNKDNTIISLDAVPDVTVNLKPNLADVKIIEDNVQKYIDDGRAINLSGTHLLKQVDIKATKKAQPLAGVHGDFRIPEGHAEQTIIIKDAENAANISTLLAGELRGVRFKNWTPIDPKHPYEVYPDVPMYPFIDTLPLTIVVDGRRLDPGDAAAVFDNSYMQPTDLIKVELVKQLANMWGKSPVLMLYTKRAAGMINKTYTPGIANIAPKGFSKVRQFYSPKYNKPDDASSQIPDLRTTIFWDPYVNTDTDGKTALSFYNADKPGTYRVVVEGINAAGELGRQIYRYKVE